MGTVRFSRYVGLKHIGPGDLTIRQWGHVADGTTFTNVFRPGRVLLPTFPLPPDCGSPPARGVRSCPA